MKRQKTVTASRQEWGTPQKALAAPGPEGGQLRAGSMRRGLAMTSILEKGVSELSLAK